MRVGRRSWEEIRLGDVLKELIPQYLSARAQELDSVPALLESGDFTGIGLIGHNLKGGGSMFGFPELTTIGHAIERASEARDPEAVVRNVAALRSLLSGVAGA